MTSTNQWLDDSDSNQLTPVSAVSTTSPTNLGLEPMARKMSEHMNLIFNLCCQLEHIADQLPDNVDKQDCLLVARSIHPVVKHAHEFEENVLFPVLREKIHDDQLLEQTLQRLQGEHLEDESYAEEVHHGLISFVSGLSEVSIDSLSYMLRGFFEGMRRHLAFEREHVLPLLLTIDNTNNASIKGATA